MNMDSLSIVTFGDVESLGEFLFENGLQHATFRNTFMSKGITTPAYDLFDANPDNLDDWLLSHSDEHQSFASLLGLNNPVNMLDVNWNVESDFYDWLASHLYIHQQIASVLGVNFSN